MVRIALVDEYIAVEQQRRAGRDHNRGAASETLHTHSDRRPEPSTEHHARPGLNGDSSDSRAARRWKLAACEAHRSAVERVDGVLAGGGTARCSASTGLLDRVGARVLHRRVEAVVKAGEAHGRMRRQYPWEILHHAFEPRRRLEDGARAVRVLWVDELGHCALARLERSHVRSQLEDELVGVAWEW